VRTDELPSIIVSGASGTVGRHFLQAAREHYRIFALARRSQIEARVPRHPNINWIQVDVAEWQMLKGLMRRVKEVGGADFILHLAAYYDFSNANHSEYKRTNVNGTRHMLELAKWLGVKRFVFASSVAACRCPESGHRINEKSAPDADFPYARSKRKGEELVRRYSDFFPCTTVRLAAVFSDWCEYPPLYVFLSTWLSHRWNSRIMAGRGESAVSYISVDDLNRFFRTVLDRSYTLPAHGVYLASPNGSTSHRELFQTSTRHFFGRVVEPLLLPKGVAAAGLVARDLAGRISGNRPFERAWMLHYVDRKLTVDASRTMAQLEWAPRPRRHVLRRLIFLIENMKSDPGAWYGANEAVLRRVVERPSLRIYQAMASMKESLVPEIGAAIRSSCKPTAHGDDPSFDRREVDWEIGLLYRLLMATVRTGDRSLLLKCADDLAEKWLEEGFVLEEILEVLGVVEATVAPALRSRPELSGLHQEIHDGVTFSVKLAAEEVEDWFERKNESVVSRSKSTVDEISNGPSLGDLERMVAQIEAFQRPSNGDSVGEVPTGNATTRTDWFGGGS
jgi:nucleoside-diphosphate-sugar epimerase